MNILVCGGRNYGNKKWLFHILDTLHRTEKIVLLVHGGAKGADTLAGEWASYRGVMCHVYPAQWDVYGKAAGAKRNQEMLDNEEIDLVVAFPGGRGTQDMIERSEKEKIPLHLPGDSK